MRFEEPELSPKDEIKSLQITLKQREKETAELRRRLEKEEKRNRKQQLKKKRKDIPSLSDVSFSSHYPSESLCHSSCYFNIQFHASEESLAQGSNLVKYLKEMNSQKKGSRSARVDVGEGEGPREGDDDGEARDEDELSQSPGRNPRGSAESAGGSSLATQHPWSIDPAEILVYKEISRGSSAHVLLGSYRTQMVAVKVMKVSSTSKHLQDFKQEFQFAQMVKSKYNVYFYGFVMKPALCLVMEYCERQSLHDLMRDPTIKIGWRHIMKFMYDFVKAVSFLHNWAPPLVHRDIKSMNVLLTADWNLKLCDFGLTRATSISQMEGTLAKVRGTYTHCAPEVFKGGTWSLMSDMYSVAIVMWEMVNRVVTGKHHVPYAEYPALKFDFQILMKASAGLRPTIPELAPQEFKELIQKGWHEKPESRYTANELLEAIKLLMEDFDERVDGWYGEDV